MKKLAILATGLFVLVASPAFAVCGMASYYGGRDGLCGSKTASGQRFNCKAMTAAHRTHKFGTVLPVSHNGKTIHVTVNDRGPFIRGRILDVSHGAAHALGFAGRGVGRVCF